MKSIRTTNEGKERKTWRKSVEKDGVTKSVSVDECENGFIISICEYGETNGIYKDSSKKYISTKNPLDEVDVVDKDKQAKEEWKEAIDALGI